MTDHKLVLQIRNPNTWSQTDLIVDQLVRSTGH